MKTPAVRQNANARFHVTATNAAAFRPWVEVPLIIAVSVGLAWFVRAGVEENAIATALWFFYLPSLLIVLMLFGGPHGAPSGSDLAIFFISFTFQNIVLWYAGRWIIRTVRARGRET